MIAGHAPLAFALAASAVALLGADRRDALLVGVAAGAFAVVPDVDMTYAVVGLLGSDAAGITAATAAFWEHSKVVHRAITHSLVLAIPAAAAFALVPGDRRSRTGAVVLASGLFAAAFLSAGPLGAAMMALYALAGGLVAAAAARQGLDARERFAAALVGLLSHPFGDLFTGTPPRMLYPLGERLLADRVVLLPEPTLNLLSVFGLELAAIWLAVLVAARLSRVRLRERIHPPAAAGLGYGAAAFVLPAPTLDVSYQFVFSVLAVGAVGVAPLSRHLDRDRLVGAALTGLLAVTLGGLAYTAVYLLATV